MISKETFISAMLRLAELDEKMDNADNAMKAFGEFSSFYLIEPFEIAFEIMEDAFHDEDGWLTAIAFNTCFLRDKHVLKRDGVEVNVNSWEEVYNFLVSRMEENDDLRKTE